LANQGARRSAQGRSTGRLPRPPNPGPGIRKRAGHRGRPFGDGDLRRTARPGCGAGPMGGGSRGHLPVQPSLRPGRPQELSETCRGTGEAALRRVRAIWHV